MQLKAGNHWPTSETPFNGVSLADDDPTFNAGLVIL